MIGVGLVTPGEEFSCDNDLADQLIEQGRATLVNDNGRTPDAETASTTDVVPAADTKSEDKPASTPKKSKVTLEAEIAADEAALATESEAPAAPESE